jgi:tripartite-type tricarboxylate transporter receptor subunit TctC
MCAFKDITHGFFGLTFRIALAALALLTPSAFRNPIFTSAVFAQSGPSVRIIVPFPPGGSADVLARLLSQEIGQRAQQTMVVENRPGGGASIAYEYTARAAPDGSTIVVAANSVVINPLVHSVNFDPVKSFVPVCNLVTSPLIFVVTAASPYRTIGDLIAAAQVKPGAITVAALGPATTQHIAFESFERTTKTNMIFVPFAGGAPVITALLGQQVDAALVNYSEGVEQIRSG